MFYYIHQQEVLFFYFVLFLIILTLLLGFVNTSLCSNYGNCLHDSTVSIKLNLLLAMMWSIYVVELARGRVFGWIP